MFQYLSYNAVCHPGLRSVTVSGYPDIHTRVPRQKEEQKENEDNKDEEERVGGGGWNGRRTWRRRRSVSWQQAARERNQPSSVTSVTSRA
eukprot:8049855-Pyramimonas_sp.AAC.1